MKALFIFLLALIMAIAFAGKHTRSACYSYCASYWDCYGKAHVSGESGENCILPINCGDCKKY